MEVLRNLPLAQVPARHAQAFMEKLKTTTPNLDDEVANLMGEVASYRTKVAILENCNISEFSESVNEIPEIDFRFKVLLSVSQWLGEYANLSEQSVFSSPFSLDPLLLLLFLTYFAENIGTRFGKVYQR
jgi:hypothetical protein